MTDRIVFVGLCALLIFLPLPIGAVEEWAVFVFEAGTVALFLLHVAGRMARRRAAWGPSVPQGGHGPDLAEIFPQASAIDDQGGWRVGIGGGSGEPRLWRPARLPLVVKAALGVFLAVSVLQIVPLPASIVRILSPHAYGIYAGLVRDAVLAPSAWWTLSLAPSATIAELVLILCYGLFGFLVLRTVRTRARAEVLVVVILASALFQAVYGMAETFSGHEMILGRAKKYGLGAVTGTFVNRNHFAGFLEMAFPLALGYLLVKARYFAMEKGLSIRRRILWFSQESLQWTLLLGLVPVFIGVGLVFSKSRSGILVLAVTTALALAAVASWRAFAAAGAGPRLGGLVRLVVVGVLAAAVWIGVGPIVRRFSETDITAESRRTFYKNTLEIVRDYPWAGTGKGTYVNAYAMYEKVDDRLRLSFAHNDYLEFAAENGAVGGGALILAGLVFLAWLAVLWRRRGGSFAKGIGLGAMLGVTALMVHGLTDFNLQIPANAVYFTTLAMLGASVLAGGGDPAKVKHRGRRRRASSLALFAEVLLAVVIFVPAGRDFLGFRELGRYRRERAAARSVESAFPGLQARLERAAAASPRAVFRSELARLDMEMARVANDSGREEERDRYVDLAVARYGKAIAANPIDAAVLYETGTAYLLYNYPLMTYQDRAKAYFREALLMKPADETINLNVLFLYFTWWPTLDSGDQAYAAGLYRGMAGRDPGFAARLEDRWTRSFGSPDALRAIVAALPLR